MNSPGTHTIIKENPWIKSENKTLLDLAAKTSSLIYIKNLEGKFIYINEGLHKRFKKPRKHFIGKENSEIFNHIIASEWTKREQKVLKSQKPTESYESIIINDTLSYFKIYRAPLKSKSGNIIGIYGILTEVTELKHKDEALIESNQKYFSLFNNNRDAILVANMDRQITDSNNSFEKLFGYSKKEIYGKPTSFIYSSISEFERMGEKLAASMGKSGFFQTITYKKKNGQLFLGETNAFYLRDFQDRIVGFVGIIRDVTKKITLEKEKEKLERIIHNKDLFISVIDHDLKGPLGTQMSLINLLHENFGKINPDKAKEILFAVKHSASVTFKLLEDLLNWARFETDALKLVEENLDIQKLINQSVELFSETAKNKNITIHTELKTGLYAIADHNMIESVIRNLLSNAIKFTPNNGDIYVKTISKRANEVEIFIKDNGVGIKNKDIDQMMTNNNISTSLGTNKEKGTGIGLLLCRQFVEINKGKIGINSSPGKGTTFYITLPGFKE